MEKLIQYRTNASLYDGAFDSVVGWSAAGMGYILVTENKRLIVIDGGFCRAFHQKTGIGGYTLIYNADGMRISAHEPFEGKENAIKNNRDILSDTVIFEQLSDKIRIRETDFGGVIRDKIADLMILLREYEEGGIKETVTNS